MRLDARRSPKETEANQLKFNDLGEFSNPSMEICFPNMESGMGLQAVLG